MQAHVAVPWSASSLPAGRARFGWGEVLNGGSRARMSETSERGGGHLRYHVIAASDQRGACCTSSTLIVLDPVRLATCRRYGEARNRRRARPRRMPERRTALPITR